MHPHTGELLSSAVFLELPPVPACTIPEGVINTATDPHRVCLQMALD